MNEYIGEYILGTLAVIAIAIIGGILVYARLQGLGII